LHTLPINERLTELGITLPSVAPPVDNHVGCVIVGRTAYVRGHGDAGRHTRTAVGMAALPFDIAVEIEMTSRVRD
jgi:enamine deaminase RidA (YjgF/YER057c/UK114 family)